jgi:type VI secretion system protein ImpK
MTQPPSLIAGSPPPVRMTDATRHSRSLVDLMYDGFYLLFMIRSRNAPADAADFMERVRQFLDEFERGAKRLNTSADDIFAAKYAFCAALDELILTSGFSIRQTWERQPLQLAFFGDQLAGENFFVKLEELRAHGATRLQVLEVFYMCLLLGFRGKFMLEGQEKLSYLVARVGDEIAHFKGKRTSFAPHWQAPDNIRNALRSEVPVWVFVSTFALLGLLAFLGLRWMLDTQTDKRIAPYADIVKLAPRAANFTITLP